MPNIHPQSDANSNRTSNQTIGKRLDSAIAWWNNEWKRLEAKIPKIRLYVGAAAILSLVFLSFIASKVRSTETGRATQFVEDTSVDTSRNTISRLVGDKHSLIESTASSNLVGFWYLETSEAQQFWRFKVSSSGISDVRYWTRIPQASSGPVEITLGGISGSTISRSRDVYTVDLGNKSGGSVGKFEVTVRNGRVSGKLISEDTAIQSVEGKITADFQ